MEGGKEMNYEEKYNEILEWARKNKARLNGVPIEEVLPELAESEDERMIERIELSLHSLKQWINGCDEMQPSRKEECITEIKEQEAWLEKQKEQKPADLSEMMVHKEPYIAPVPTPMVVDEQKPVKPSGKLSRKEYLYQLLIDQLITYSDYEYLTKQKPAEVDESTKRLNDNWMKQHFDDYQERKSAEWTELQSEFKNINEAFEEGKKEVIEHPEKYGLQKPVEWDELDKDCLNRAIWYIENPAPSVVKDTNLILWLKSLPGRLNLQPKQEWSENKTN